MSEDTVEGYEHVKDTPLGPAIETYDEEAGVLELEPVYLIFGQNYRHEKTSEEIAEGGSYSVEQVEEALEYAEDNFHEIAREDYELMDLVDSASGDEVESLLTG